MLPQARSKIPYSNIKQPRLCLFHYHLPFPLFAGSQEIDGNFSGHYDKILGTQFTSTASEIQAGVTQRPPNLGSRHVRPSRLFH